MMKKGSQETFSALSGLFISILLVFTILFGVVGPVYSETMRSGEGFDLLVDKLRGLGDADFDGEFPFTIGEDYIVIGFNGKDVFPRNDCYGWYFGENERSLKVNIPGSCSGNCLCFCNIESSVMNYKEIARNYESRIKIVDDYGNYVFVKPDVCEQQNDVCVDMEKLNFFGRDKCNFFFVPGVDVKGESRGSEPISLVKEGNKVYVSA